MIGCGGSGVNTLRYLRKSAKEALAKAGWDGPFPQAWQFIGVDVVAQSPSDPFGTEPIPVSDFISIGPGISYQNIQSVMETKHRSGGPGCIEMLGWKPTWAEINSPVAQSLGQWRSVVRIAGLAVLMPQFGRRLTQAYAEIKSSSEEFQKITNLLTGSESSWNTKDMEPLVIVVGSMAGATGSAIMFDINELVQRVNAAIPGVFNVVYSADVFDSIVGSTNPGLHANSLAFMSELLTYSWNGGKSSDLIDYGIKKEYIAPPLTFMIESSNLHGRKMSNSYKESFQQIASWLTDVAVYPEQQDRLLGVLERRNPHSLMTIGGYGFEKSAIFAPPGAIYSLGHAKLTVGRDRFPDYASKLLQREIVDFLLNGEGADTKSQFKSQSALISALSLKSDAENLLESFLVGAKMSVSSELEKHFIDSLFNAVDTESFSKMVKLELEKEVEAAVNNGADQVTGLNIGVQQATDRYLQNFGNVISKVIKELDHVLSGVSAEVNRSIENSSIPIVKEVLSSTHHLISRAAGEIRNKASELKRKSEFELSKAVDALKQKEDFRRGIERKAELSHIDFAANSVSFGFQTQCLEYLAMALEEFADGQLTHTVDQLDDAIKILQSRFEEMVDWPKIDQDVPTWLRPRQFEFCLERSDSWPESLRTLIGESQVPAADSDMHLMRIARNSILTGGYESYDGKLRGPLFDVSAKDSQIIDAQRIEDRVNDWLRRNGSGFIAFVEEGLQGYLREFSWTNEKIVDHQQRLIRYAEVLKDVLDACQPLVQINENLSKEVYRNRALIAYPQFQLPRLENAANGILEELMSRYFPGIQDLSNRYCGGDANSSSFNFTSFLNSPINPSVFRRFTESQAAFVNSRMDSANQWSYFHKWRRSRKLSEYIPLPTELRHAAIRGFAVGRILGYITVDTNESIKISGMDREYTFPRRLLTPSGPKNLLPALLESMSLCFAEVPIHGQEAFGAYREMISLGVGSDGSPNSFVFENECLKYITTGSRLRIPVDTKRVEMMSAETPSERQYKMVAYLNDNISRYEEVLASVEAAPDLNLFSADDKLTIELIEDLLPSYQMVIDSVRRYVDETCIDYF